MYFLCPYSARGEDIFEEKDIAYRIKDLSELDLILERDY